MNNKCDYSSFFNEFKISFDKKFKIIPFYNGYYFTSNYDKNLQKRYSNFKHDLLYVLPFNTDGKPEVFLKNLHQELQRKQSKLNRYKNHIKRKGYKHTIPHRFNIKESITKKYQRRNSKMQNKQLHIIKNALYITEQAIESFNNTTRNNKAREKNENYSKIEVNSQMIWNGDKVGLIQLIKSLIKVKAIQIGSLKENEAISIISNFFNTNINKNNLSSFSRAIHSNNTDYHPEIFNKILRGYEIIIHEKREKLEAIRK